VDEWMTVLVESLCQSILTQTVKLVEFGKNWGLDPNFYQIGLDASISQTVGSNFDLVLIQTVKLVEFGKNWGLDPNFYQIGLDASISQNFGPNFDLVLTT
jgi:hypothetical protein